MFTRRCLTTLAACGLAGLMSFTPAITHAAAGRAGQVVVHVATYEAVTTVRLLNLRAAPSLQARVILQLPNGATLRIHGYTAHWLQVATLSGVAGYVIGRDVRAIPSSMALKAPVSAYRAPFLVVNVSGAHLRTAPSLSATVRLVLGRGAVIALHATQGSWAEVTTRNGTSGWIWRALTRPLA